LRDKKKLKDQKPRRCCEKYKKHEKSKCLVACPNEKTKITKSRLK
jgi:hypothetical protein